MTGEDIEDIEDTVPEVAVWLPVPPAGAGSWPEAPWWAQQWEFPASVMKHT